MSCQLIYKNGKLSGVKAPNGNPSTLFKSIATNPHIQTLEEAVEIYKNVFINKFFPQAGKINLNPETSSNYANMTEDGKGNYVFYHYSKEEREEINASASGSNLITSREESAATSKVGGVSMFYTNRNVAEPGVGNIKHMIKVPMNEVYDFNTDSENLIKEAKELFQEQYPGQAFNPNTQAAYMTLVASKKGYKMLVAEWGDNRSRAQSVEPLKPHDVMLSEGDRMVRPFKEDYESNLEKGYKQVIPETKENKLKELYLKMNRERSSQNKYDAVYHLYVDYLKKTQEEVDKDIEDSDISDELKQEYREAKNYEEGSRKSVLEVEPTLSYKTPSGNVYNSYSEALKNTNEGLIQGVAGGVVLFEVNSNTNPNSANGFINYYIKSGLMSDTKVIEDGESFLVAEGDDATKAVNEFIIDEDAKYSLGTENRTVTKDGRITIRDKKGKITLSNGKTIKISDLSSMSNEEITEQFPEEAEMLMVSKAIKETILDRAFGTPAQEDFKIKLSEDELKIRLLGLLEKMGINLMSIEEYSKKYKIRNGVEPSANALADIANQIIAFKNGEITIEALSEETAHFIVEAWDEVEIENLIRNIDKTEEYKEFAEFYRDIYSRQGISGEALEKTVRREILGKILAKSMVSNFSAEASTEFESNVIEKIKSFFDNFIQKVARLFSNKNENSLIDFTNQVNDLLMNQNVDNYLNLEGLKEKKFVMYQANPISNDLLLRQSKVLVQVLEQQERDLLRADKGSKSNVKKLKENGQKLNEAVLKNSIAEFIVTSKRQVAYITESANAANKSNNFLTNEESIVYHSLKSAMAPTLAQIKNYLVGENKSENKDLIEEINKVITGVSDIEGKIQNQETRILDSIISRMMVRHSLPESTRQMLTDATKATLHDTTAFYATFGQLSHARDPLLNLAGTIIHDLEMDANVNFLRITKEFQKGLRDLGFKEKDLAMFFDNGYILDIRDWKSFEEKEAKTAAEVYKNVTGIPITVEQIIEYRRDPKGNKELADNFKELTPEQNQKYAKEYRNEMAPYLETVFTEEYYKEEEAKYEKNDISDLTIRERRDLSVDRGVLLARVKDIDGKVRFKRQDEIDIKALNIKRKKLKSLQDEMGNIKLGITEPTKIAGDNRIIDSDTIVMNGLLITIDKKIASDEARIAFDLHKLDLLYEKEGRDNPKELSNEFLNELREIEKNEGREEALIFLRLNSNTTFSESYWDSLGDTQGFLDRLEQVDGAEEVADKIRTAFTKRKQMLKQYQDSTDTMVSEMSTAVKTEILSLTNQIDTLFLEGSRMMGDTRTDEEVSEPTTENTPNESYYNATKNMSKQERIQFILENTTETNKQKINEFIYATDNAAKGGILSKSKQRQFNKFDKGSKEDTQLAFAESRIAPYYVRFAPIGFSEYQKKLEKSSESVFSIANEMNADPNLQLTNNFSYYTTKDQAYRNKNFKADFEGGFFQPKISEFKNQKFEEMFSPTIVGGEVQSVGKNQELYELYTKMMAYHRSNLSIMGESGTHNLWKAPQISKTGINKFVDIITKKDKTGTIKEFIKDAIFYRVDDQEYGAEVDGESIIKTIGARFIPKYYLRDLENSSDVSSDLFYSMTAFGQQAQLYASRKNYYSDMMAIQDALTSGKRDYPDGKAAESTATVKMFKSAMDAYLFGVKESKQLKVTLPIIGQVDLTKTIRLIHAWVIKRNLGLNAVVPFTSWITAEASTLIEKHVGEFMNPHSTGLARLEFGKLATDAIKDTLEINSTAKLSVMLEHFGISDFSTKLSNTMYSTMGRFMPKVGMSLNQAANFPIIPRIMLNVLYDYRVVGEDILTFNQFSDNLKENKSKKEIVEEWKALESKALYNYMIVDESSVTYDINKLKAETNRPGDFEEFMEQKGKAVATKMREMVKIIDGQIPAYEKSAAQRHFFLSFFTTHRGWLAIAYARRFKNKHLNFQTGQKEQGSYRTLADFLSKNMAQLYSGGFKDFIKNSKAEWEKADEIERANMKRVMTELAFLQGIVGIGWLIGAMADDDENKDLYALQLTNYLYFRLMNETTSSQTAIGQQFYEMIKSPIVGAETVKSIFSVANYFDTDEIKSGRYAGKYKFQKQLMNVLPGYKSALDVINPRDAYNSYRHFNTSVETYNPIMYLLEAGS